MVFGGRTQDKHLLNDAWELSLAYTHAAFNTSWRLLAPEQPAGERAPTPRRGHSALHVPAAGGRGAEMVRGGGGWAGQWGPWLSSLPFCSCRCCPDEWPLLPRARPAPARSGCGAGARTCSTLGTCGRWTWPAARGAWCRRRAARASARRRATTTPWRSLEAARWQFLVGRRLGGWRLLPSRCRPFAAAAAERAQAPDAAVALTRRWTHATPQAATPVRLTVRHGLRATPGCWTWRAGGGGRWPAVDTGQTRGLSTVTCSARRARAPPPAACWCLGGRRRRCASSTMCGSWTSQALSGSC